MDGIDDSLGRVIIIFLSLGSVVRCLVDARPVLEVASSSNLGAGNVLDHVRLLSQEVRKYK